MKKNTILTLSFVLLLIAANAQAPAKTVVPKSGTQSSKTVLFDSDKILTITLKGDIRKLFNNRTGKANYFPIILSYKGQDSNEISISIHVKTRGHFRRLKENCLYPPLLLHFSNASKPSLFPENTSLKLVMPCRGEKYIVHEWLVYKLYNLVTPESFRARLVKVKLEDDKNKKMPSPFYGFILEEEHQMAKRNHEIILKEKIKPQQTMTEPFLKMAVFEYLIGNTDWSVEFQQNIKLIAANSSSVPVAVPYDFDQAGIVEAPYALPAEELKMSSVRQRRYRGYCVKDIKSFDNIIDFYNRLKNDIYKTYTGCSLLNAKYIKETIKYLDEFYATINNPKSLQKAFEYPCDPNGTGNVIIKGLRED
ncbi:MAG TPA: hypothetical protein VMU83_16515 [Hanamia sp.]|nr:hypothetical protein [Hanamia sp.]